MKRTISLLLALVMLFTLLPKTALAADGATLTVSGSYSGKYVVIAGDSGSALYYINSSGTVETTGGTAAVFAPGSYTVYYGIGGSGSGRGNESTFASGSFTVAQGDSTASVQLRSTQVSNSSANVTHYATSLFYNTATFDHVDVRVAGSYVLNVGDQSYTATVSNPTAVVKVGGQVVASQTWTGTTSYEWRQTGLTLTKASVITLELTLDLTYTDSQGQTHVLEDVQIVYDSVNNVDRFVDAIAICDMVQGLDFRVTVEDIEEEIRYYTVSYEWKVYNTDGSYTELPAGAPSEPASSSGHVLGEQYAYDTAYTEGTSFYDYDAGLLYTFHGWDTYSHSAVYNPVPSTGYPSLEGLETIEITADTYIYGYWTVTELPPASAHIAIEKIFLVDGVEASMAAAEDLWFRIDTGIDRDGDGETLIDVDYPMIAATGEYKIPVYQYDTPFVFTEMNADVPGYSRSTSVTVTGDRIVSSSQSGDSVTVTMDPVYQGENIHLGTVTYINSYTKNIGTPIALYPTLTLLKTASDTHAAQAGVEFTLYADAACTQAVSTVTTGEGGLVQLDFGALEGIAPGTYYLKETQPLAGYLADPCVYAITLAVADTTEELRGDQFVTVTRHTISVEIPQDSTATWQQSGDYYRLHIYNQPVLGSLKLTKTVTGVAEADLGKIRAAVTVHGPITRDAAGTITGIGSTWQLTLSQDGGWAASLEALPLGEYLIHESFASVHGYTWTGVTYGELPTTVYNGITSGIFRVENETALALELTNTYTPWTAADFFIKKVDPQGDPLAGATFRLSTDEAGTDVVDEKVTGADGYAHFEGLTVPEGQGSVTYYLREIQAPAGYYLPNQLYKVVITAVTLDGHTTYEPEISLVAGRSTGFDIDTDLLTVTNFPITGRLTVTKAFTDGLLPQDLEAVTLQIGGPNGFSRVVELSNANGWSVTLEGLPLGQYTVTEPDANVPGYTWQVAYSETTVTLAEETPGRSGEDVRIEGSVTVTNTYTPNEEFFEIPTSLTVKKVDAQGQPLAGAVFSLNRLDANGQVLASTSFTSNAEGIVVFDLLTGFMENGQPISATYRLTETQAPEGYEATDTTWTVTVREDDGQIRVVLNEEKNVFENFWDWAVGDVSPGTWEDGVLTVVNHKKANPVTVSVNKVWYTGEAARPDSVSVTLYRDGEAFDTVTLSEKNRWQYSWEGLTDEFQWEVDEPSVPSGYNKTVRQNGYHFTIVNTYEDIPKTGGVSGLVGFGALTGVGIAGFGTSLLALLAPRKKKEEEE